MNTQTTTTSIDFALQTQINQWHAQPETVIQLIESGERIDAVLDASWGICNQVLVENNEDYANSHLKAVAALTNKVSA